MLAKHLARWSVLTAAAAGSAAAVLCWSGWVGVFSVGLWAVFVLLVREDRNFPLLHR